MKSISTRIFIHAPQTGEDISFDYKMGVEKYAYFHVDIFYQSTQILGLIKLFKAGFGILPNINIQL